MNGKHTNGHWKHVEGSCFIKKLAKIASNQKLTHIMESYMELLQAHVGNYMQMAVYT